SARRALRRSRSAARIATGHHRSPFTSPPRAGARVLRFFIGSEGLFVMSFIPHASAADVEWVDTHGEAQVAGYFVTSTVITALEQRGDRRADGKLTRAAKARIAADLTGHLQYIHRFHGDDLTKHRDE